ncbi:fancd2 [Anticarsia gemmatalis]|uniref:fancd2 n=1 Tax=Anticarsia gemmatalis TaxID=129554 RepID=UPI003F77101F
MSKRSLSQKNHTSPNKKSRTTDSTNYFHVTLRESGLNLKHPPDKCVASQETIHIIRNIKKNLEKHFDYPRNLSDLFSNFEKECKDLNIFKHYLFPNIVRLSEDSGDEYPVGDSVIKILLSVPILQSKLTDYIFEKAIDLAAELKCGPWIQMLLKCISSLDTIANTDKMSTNLINLLDVAEEKMVKLEIITAIPDIIGDQEHDNIAAEMSRILSEDHDLIPAILDCLSYLCLSDEQYEQLQKKTLTLLSSLSKCNYFPNFVKFLLIPGRMSDAAYLEAVQGLRNALGWPSTAAQPQEIATSQVLTATAIRNSIVSSKVIGNSWLKVISSCKVHTDHKPIDFILLLISYSTSEEKQRQVDNLIRKQIKLNTLKEELLDEAFSKFKPILKEYLRNLIELANSLLKTKGDPTVEAFASHLYTLMFAELEECCQTIVAELLQLGLDSKQCVMNILLILNKVALKDMSVLKPQSVQMLTLLDRMDDMPLNEVRAVMNLLCGLAYSYENSVIRDDIHMIIRKELGSSNPTIKVQGILAAIHAVKYLMIANSDDNETRELPDDVSYGSVTFLAEGDLREAAKIIELISCSTRQFPDMIAFFYDELSKVISSASVINKNFLVWLTDAVTNDLQQNFIVDNIETDRIGELKLSMQYCLNAESEMDEVIAINIAGLTLQTNSEVCVAILSPLFQLVQILHCKQHSGNLSSIDALLGCPVVMPKFNIDMIEDMDSAAITNILDCLVHCVNWFRELLNAFALQDEEDLKTKTLKRIVQIEELETFITEILMKTKISYKPPVCTFNVNKYTGEQGSKRPAKMPANSTNKKKVSKKAAQDDTVLPETAKSQATQNNQSVKNSLEISHNLPMRQLNLNILHLLNTDMSDDKESDTELTVKTLNFLLKCINSNIENVLISKIKRQTFLTKQEPEAYDAVNAEKCAKSVSEILPKLMEHLKCVSALIEKFINEDEEDETEVLFTAENISYLTCLEYIYNLCTIYFKWIGFRNQQHNALLKSSLRTIANPAAATVSLKDLIIAVVQFLQKHEKYCLQLSTAVSLIEFLKSIQNYSDNRIVLNILRNLAESFLSKQWKTPEGVPEKGLYFNQSVDRFASIYFINNEVLALKNLTLQLTSEIKLLRTRTNTLSNLKCINKNNFPILYRNLGTALYDATKTRLDKGMTNSEHLGLWKDVATVLKNMSEIAKSLETRNNLSAFFKKSLPVLKLFLSQGIPILEIQFKNDTEEVLEILKILQQTTRFLQTLCCHSRLKKDTVLMSKVPHMRQLLETLIYKVKAVLAANKCSEAFWMGNLKNKDIHGEVIASQQSVEDEESVDDCDEQLPEDEVSDDSDDEMINPGSRSVSDIV